MSGVSNSALAGKLKTLLWVAIRLNQINYVVYYNTIKLHSKVFFRADAFYDEFIALLLTPYDKRFFSVANLGKHVHDSGDMFMVRYDVSEHYDTFMSYLRMSLGVLQKK